MREFLVCILFGAGGALLYDLLPAARLKAPLRYFLDAAFCIACGALFLCLSVWLALPSPRWYYAAGVAAGFALYSKSLHKIVAIIAEKLYNTGKKRKRKMKICPKNKRA